MPVRIGGFLTRFLVEAVPWATAPRLMNPALRRVRAGSASPVALSNRYDSAYFRRADSGDEPDSSAFRYAEGFDAVHMQAMALPEVARLHALCCADHVKAIVEKAGGRAEEDPRYGRFLEQAAAQV